MKIHRRAYCWEKNWYLLRVSYITANHATFPIQMYAIVVLICGNFWGTQYFSVPNKCNRKMETFISMSQSKVPVYSREIYEGIWIFLTENLIIWITSIWFFTREGNLAGGYPDNLISDPSLLGIGNIARITRVLMSWQKQTVDVIKCFKEIKFHVLWGSLSQRSTGPKSWTMAANKMENEIVGDQRGSV